MKLFARLEKSKDFWFLLITSGIFFLLRLPSLFEPYWYGDEGIYQTIAQAINNGNLLYRDIWDNKPPVLYLLYALFDGDQFSTRLLSLLFGILSIIVFFFLLKKLLALNETTKKLPLYIATALFAYLFAIPLFEGNIANAENFMILPILTAAFLLIRYFSKPTPKALLYVGILLSFAFLIKIVAIFDLAAFVIFFLIESFGSRRKFITTGKDLALLAFGFFFPIVLTILFFAVQGGLSPFISAVFQQNIGYVGYGNTFIIPQGLLYFKIALLLGGVILLFYQKKHIQPGSLFIYLWILFSLFNAHFSQRPYTHYILVLLPSFCLFVGLLLSPLRTKFFHIGSAAISVRLIYTIVLLAIVLLTWKNFDIYKKNLAYYENFFAYMMQKKDLTSYQTFFDADMPRAYEVAQFLKLHTKKHDTVFVWGNPAQVYKMSDTQPPGKYTVAYHITNSRENLIETTKALSRKKPRFIVLLSSKTYPFDLSSYRYVYSIRGASIYESLF